MTVSSTTAAGSDSPAPTPVDFLTVTIDNVSVHVPKGTLVIRAAELAGIQIPRFCDHPLLDPVGACRQCIVEVEGQRKPLTSCTTTCTEGMVVKTQHSSPVAEKAQRGMIELLLINHPLDCPICDKGGECPLQNQSMSNGSPQSRFHDVKRTFPKPIAISAQVLLDRERCVLCARCTRFSQQIAGDPFIEMFERGALQQVAIYADEPFESYFAGNTVQICPVGALTGASYRFRARPFDLVSSPTVCEHCASGCAMRTDWRRGRVMRRLAGDDPEVNEEWNCDKGRWAFVYAAAADRLTTPLVRDQTTGRLEPSSWPEALDFAARGLAVARGRAGVLPGGRLTTEDAYAYAKFARVALGTNDVDMRARPHSAEEAEFLAARVAGAGLGVTYAQLERATGVLLVGLEPEEESPILFLRLRKAARKHGVPLFSVAPFLTPSVEKCFGRLLRAAPGTEAEFLDALLDGGPGSGLDAAGHDAARMLRTDRSVVLVGERLAGLPGALSAAARLADATGARLAWVPRRAGERGSLEAGALPNLLPGGRPVADDVARAEVERAWGSAVPSAPGRDTNAILTAAATGELAALVVGAVDPADLPDPALALAALDAVPFLVSLELRASAVTERADVVFPVAPVVEKSGTFCTWEGRLRPFAMTLANTGALSDSRVLNTLAEEMDCDFGLPDTAAASRELAGLGRFGGPRPAAPSRPAGDVPQVGIGRAVLATWHWLLDNGRLQDGEPHLAGTAKRPRLHLSLGTAREIGVRHGELVTVSTARGSITLPLIVADIADRVVWLPTNSPGSAVRATLGVDAGAVVSITAGGIA